MQNRFGYLVGSVVLAGMGQLGAARPPKKPVVHQPIVHQMEQKVATQIDGRHYQLNRALTFDCPSCGRKETVHVPKDTITGELIGCVLCGEVVDVTVRDAKTLLLLPVSFSAAEGER